MDSLKQQQQQNYFDQQQHDNSAQPSKLNKQDKKSKKMQQHEWIRGVNLGGWLVLERYIVPYQFAITDCHVAGDYCWYPGALSAPPPNNNDTSSDDVYYKLCDLNHCSPYRMPVLNGTGFDYPVDEWTLAAAFLNGNPNAHANVMLGYDNNTHNHSTINSNDTDIIIINNNNNDTSNSKNNSIGETWFNFHFDNFITKSDIQKVYDLGITHLRVPLPHWILGDISENEPYIVGNRWAAFRRLVTWVREINRDHNIRSSTGKRTLEIWPNLHTAPGSQNGFDNSGLQASSGFTCHGWDRFPSRVNKTLDIIHHITQTMRLEHMLDVVTGFGLLNEPFGDCNDEFYRQFLDDALDVARANLGTNSSIFVSDKFFAPKFNDGSWWLDEKRYTNTYLDSHFYHVFWDDGRLFTPAEHVQLTCAPDDIQLSITSCCFQDAVLKNATMDEPGRRGNIPSTAVRRIATEWSVAFDAHPGELLKVVMDGIALNGIAPNFHRQLSDDSETQRRAFLKEFAQAQMVAYEASNNVQESGGGLSDGWFYWSIKMEGGSFAEWDFVRGVEQGYIPPIVADRTVASADVYGTCDDITQRVMAQNYTYEAVVHAFPWMDEPYWRDNVPWTIPVRYPPNETHSVWYNVSSNATTTTTTTTTTSTTPLAPTPPVLAPPQQQQQHSSSVWVHVGAVVLAMYLLRSLYHVVKMLFCNNGGNINRSEYTPIQEVTTYYSNNDQQPPQKPTLKHVRTLDTFAGYSSSSSNSFDDGSRSDDDGRDGGEGGNFGGGGCGYKDNDDDHDQFARTMNV
jgi:glucan 1,3-beta-glucosidase